jgi:hypothetical protein
MPNLSTSNISGMVFKQLQKKIHPKDSVNGFPQRFQLCSHIAQGHISHQNAHILEVTCLLTMTKPLGGVHPIIIRETLYQFTSRVLCFQFLGAFATHLSSHQFGIVTKARCEIVIHGIKCTLDFHLGLVVPHLDIINAFNSMLGNVIFQKLCAIDGDIK